MREASFGLEAVRRAAGFPRQKEGALTGEYYEATVPDTLDLAERARLLVNGLTGMADPTHDYETFQCLHLDTNPACYSLNCAGPCVGKPLAGLAMARRISGSAQNLDYDEKMIEVVVKDIDEDGLWWMRVEGRPWRQGLPCNGEDTWWPFPQGRLLTALLERHRFDRNDRWLTCAQRLADGLCKVAFRNRKTNHAWWEASNNPRIQLAGMAETYLEVIPLYPNHGNEEPETTDCHQIGQAMRGLVQWTMLKGNRNAGQVAQEAAQLLLKPSMWGNSEGPTMVAGNEHGFWEGHFHTRTAGLVGLVDYALAENDLHAQQLVRDGYDYARHFGIRRLGFFPAAIGPVEKMRQHNRQRYGGPGQVCETCGIGDMAYIAVKLSEAGIGDYWEDVDGYVRNQLMEHQLTRREGLEEIIAAAEPYQTNPEIHCTENVIDRALGSFLTVSDPTLLHPWFTTCCPGNATSGMSAVWEATVRCRDNVAQVNLLLNRASHWLDVESHLPYEGKVVIRNKTANRIHVRIPVWVDRKAVRCQVNARDISNTWLVNYLVIEPVQPRDVVTITFPMSETVERFTLPDYEMTYTCRFKGNTCVDISPRPDTFNWSLMDADDEAHIKVNKGIDLYQRDSMKADRAPTKRVVRYIHPW